MGWPVGVLLGFASALASSVGFLMRHRGAVAAPEVDGRHPVRTAIQLFRQRWWLLGYGVAAVAWLLHVASLKLAPLSLVQAALAGEADPHGARSGYALAGAIAVEAALMAAGLALIASPPARRAQGQRALLLATAAGLLFTVSHVGIKALSGMLRLSDPASFATPWVPLVVTAFLVAFFTSARSLQLGNAIAVIAVTGASSNITAIAAGIVVFGDPVGDNGLIVALRMAAFALVVLAAALMPAPTRVAGARRPRARAREPVAA